MSRLTLVAIELRDNLLLLPCMGGGEHQHCGGWIRVPFANPICGERAPAERYWEREGETLDTLTLTPSVNAGDCGHFTITSGEVKQA